MVLGSSDANRVELLAGDMVMEQEEDLNLFYITEHNLVNTSHPRKGVSMEIKFKRKIMRDDDDLSALHASHDDHLRHHLLQALLLRGSLECEPDNHAGDDNNLHQQDGGLTPHL